MAINQEPHIHNLVMATNIFICKDGKWLLLHRSPKKRFAPDVVHPYGGKIDADENPLIGAQREVFEETGVKVKNVKLEAVLLEIAPVKEMNENWLIFHFSADYDTGELKETDEGTSVLLTTEEVKQQKLFPSVKIVIDHILNPDDGTVFATISYNDDGTVNKDSLKVEVCSKK